MAGSDFNSILSRRNMNSSTTFPYATTPYKKTGEVKKRCRSPMRWVSTKSAGERCFLYAKADWDARVVVMSACDEAKIDPLSV